MIDETTDINELKEDTFTEEKTYEQIKQEYDDILAKYEELNERYLKCVEKNNELFNRLTFKEEEIKISETDKIINILGGK